MLSDTQDVIYERYLGFFLFKKSDLFLKRLLSHILSHI